MLLEPQCNSQWPAPLSTGHERSSGKISFFWSFLMIRQDQVLPSHVHCWQYLAPQHPFLVKIFGLQQHFVLITKATFSRHPIEPQKGVDLRPKDIFEESLGIPGRRDQFSDRCGDGETNRGMMGQNTLSVHLESVILQTLNS